MILAQVRSPLLLPSPVWESGYRAYMRVAAALSRRKERDQEEHADSGLRGRFDYVMLLPTCYNGVCHFYVQLITTACLYHILWPFLSFHLLIQRLCNILHYHCPSVDLPPCLPPFFHHLGIAYPSKRKSNNAPR